MSSISSTYSDPTNCFPPLKKKDSPKKPERIKKSSAGEEKEGTSKKDSIERRGSFFKMKPLLEGRYSHLMTEGERLSLEAPFNYSPRINPINIDAIAKQIGDYLGSDFPMLLAQIIAQISYNQYAFVSSNSYILAAGLKKEGLLKPFLLAIARLTDSASPLSLVRSRRLIEVGLRVIGHPSAKQLIDSREIKMDIDRILFAATQNLKSPKFQELIYKAEATAVLYEKKQNSSKELAKEGLSYLSLLIHDSIDKDYLKKIQTSNQNTPFEEEKNFLLLTNHFFLNKKHHLRINPLQQESLVRKCLNIFLADKGEDLLKLSEIKEVARKLLDIDLLESSNPEIEQLMRWTGVLLNIPSKSLKKEELSEELAQRGLHLLAESIPDPRDQAALQEIRSKYEKDSLSIQKIFLTSLHLFLLKGKYIDLDLPEQELLLQLAIRILTSNEGEALVNESKIKKIAKEFLELDLTKYKSPETEKLILGAKIQIHSALISLKELQLLLFWIQSDLSKIENAHHLAAGTREWDPEGEIYLFTLSRIVDLTKELNIEADALRQLLHFILCWREAPANRDLLRLPSFLFSWQKFIGELTRRNEQQEIIEPDFLAKLKYSGFLDKEIAPHDLGNPVFDLTKLTQLIPEKPHDMWNKETIVKDLRDGIIFHILKTSQSIGTKDLAVHSKTKMMLSQAENFNKITQFLVGQILACGSESEIKHIIKILCSLQLEFLKYSAFEAAFAVHGTILQASVIRLKPLFSKVEFFFDLFEDRSALCFQQKNATEIRKLQDENKGVLEASCLIRKDLEFLRRNSSPFTEEGKINLDHLQLFGKLFNRVAAHKPEALSFWTTSMQITPNAFILKAFESQSGQIDGVTEDCWWNRSLEIHPEGSNIYYQIERPNSGRK
ncbi:MAG TPA: hypothetical protein DCE71_06005 [Parachlamydiales bacterium]|nr:hypothetical protein [Parachlamydiales bacterium]